MRAEMMTNLRCAILLASVLGLGCESEREEPKSQQVNPSTPAPDAGEPDSGDSDGDEGPAPDDNTPPPPNVGGEPSGDAGPGDTPSDADATRFCEDYEPVCGFGEADRFADADDCAARFNAAPIEKRRCVQAHLDLAAVDPATHCPHASGQGPCDIQVPFCDAYETACGFGKAGSFVDATDCNASFDAFGEQRKACVTSEVGLAQSDPDTHCPPASGGGACSDQALFCQVQEATCGFGGKDRFKDLAACEEAFGSFDAKRQTCVLERLSLAQSDPKKHCPESTGDKKPCDK